jgi:predicted enzyme related to lactoylglutathione lyase
MEIKMPPLNKIVIYARDIKKTATFYERFFGFEARTDPDGGIIELVSKDSGANILIHQAAKSIKLGQVGVKLVFQVDDVELFKQQSEKLGLKFGSTHSNADYSFANAKDPDKNSVCVSSRAIH